MIDLPSTKAYVCALEATQKRWTKILDGGSILYLYGMSGLGKTTQALSFAERYYKEYVRFTANEEHFPELVTEWLESHKKRTSRTLLILDDVQWVCESEKRQKLFALLLQSHAWNRLHIMILSRASLPGYLSPLWMTRQLIVEDQEALRLEKEQIREILLQVPALVALPAEQQYRCIDGILQISRGYGLGVTACLHRLAQCPEDIRTAMALAVQDIRNFLDEYLMTQWPQSRRSAALRLCVFSQFDRKMAEQMLGNRTDEVLQDFVEAGSFLIFTAPDTYTFAPFFREYLEHRLQSGKGQEWRSLYETAAACYEERRDLESALYCYKQAGRIDRIADLVVYLSENAEGCAFARIAQQYMEELPEEWEKKDPRILGAKAMLSAYRMQPRDCMRYLEQLRLMTETKEKSLFQKEALAVYVRTVIACPCNTADELKEHMLKFVDCVLYGGLPLRNIMPTGNLPSLINGGLDLLPWAKNRRLLYPIIRAAAEKLMGREAAGSADAAMGEILYELNKKTKAMTSLAKALSDAGLKGSIRVEYAATAIMARLFQAESENATAVNVLQNIRQKTEQQHFAELLPNIDGSLVLCSLLENDGAAYTRWLEQSAPDEYGTFYITARFQLLVKARVYTALGRTMEALYIIDMLLEYALLYHRIYLQIELLTLKAIILYRREEEWGQPLLEAVKQAMPYGLVRIFADQGTALLPLWQEMEWGEDIPAAYISLIGRECKSMAKAYPEYLEPPRRFGAVTDKEMEVLRLMALGKSNSQIAQELGINLGTAKFHVKNIMQKLSAGSRTVAVKIAQEKGML